MKPYRLLAIVLVLLVVAGIGAQQWSSTVTYQSEWRLARAEADEDAGIDLTTVGNYDNIPSDALKLRTASELNAVGAAVGFACCAGAAADKTFTVLYVGWRRENGMAQRLASVAYTTGTQAVVKYPHTNATATDKFWADTAVVTAYTGNTIIESDNDGGNGVAEIAFDVRGIGWVKAYVSNADGVTGAEAGNVSVYMYEY